MNRSTAATIWICTCCNSQSEEKNACQCGPSRCLQCYGCSSHCDHPCIVCGKAGQMAWIGFTQTTGSWPCCPDHSHKQIQQALDTKRAT